MIDVYILLSNEFSFLDIQVELIKKYVSNLGQIYAVMGPVNELSIFKNNFIKDVPYEKIVIPPERRFFPPKPMRLAKIVNYLMENYVDKSGNTALIIHADVFPVSEFIMPKEFNIIGKGARNKANFAITWLAINPKHRLINYSLDKSYLAYFPTGKKFEKIFGTAKEDGLNIEWCGPCFIHTDDCSRNVVENPELKERKLQFLKDYLKRKENIKFDDSQILPQDLISLTKRYTLERKKWVNAGKPLRSPEEIERIFRICQACPFFFAESSASGSCNICGCQIKRRGKLMNKAAWATTECPKTPSEWNEDLLTTLVDNSKNTESKKCCGGK